ncbi:hypothetical protein [Paenibacillus sediminis]|uniref:Uncharacterized protein n=1 Tax=Paenibacillus sediminis TaxID=664909 RepID=A0ABS4H801_9BACL|nr:hypothetical protein [Paenibacillus sediminis]MBP1938659.1 hypothetical protein [Paenibacillus sediminis]
MIQPDTSFHLTASRPPFGLKVEGRREYNNVRRNASAKAMRSIRADA